MKGRSVTVGLILVLGAGLIVSVIGVGWSPWNLLFGPQAEFPSRQDDYTKRLNRFVKEDLPHYYPMLIKHLQKNKSEIVMYENQFGEPQHIRLTLDEDGGFSIGIEITDKSRTGVIVMMDGNKDTKLDRVAFVDEKNDPALLRVDDHYIFMWHSLLAVAIKNSGCCN